MTTLWTAVIMSQLVVTTLLVEVKKEIMDIDYFSRANAVVGASEGGANFDVRNGQAILKPNAVRDKGGPTIYGITQGALSNAARQGIVKHSDITRLTKDEADVIYRANYWRPSGAGQMPWGLCLIHFDLAVNSGVGTAGRMLQRSLNEMGAGLNVDGMVGPNTIAAVKKYSGKELEATYLALRTEHYNSIVAKDESQKIFLTGWLRRLERVRNAIS